MWILCLKLTMAKYNLDKDLNQFPSPKKGHVFIMWKRNAGVKNIHSKGKKISQILHWTPDTHTHSETDFQMDTCFPCTKWYVHSKPEVSNFA